MEQNNAVDSKSVNNNDKQTNQKKNKTSIILSE